MTIQRILVFTGLVFLTLVLVAVLWLFILNQPPAGVDMGSVEVTIETGMTAREIGALLEREGLVRSGWYFRLVARLTGRARQFKAGSRPIPTTLTPTGIARLLTTLPPQPPDLRVTVVEGLTIAETASALLSQAGIDSAQFVTLASDSVLAAKLGVDNATLEGYLYPDTYFIRPEADAHDMIRRMKGRFDEVFADSLRARAAELGMTVQETVTLASIIEREATIDAERPLVSSVFHRRLERDRPLEANPTIQYAIGSKRRVLYDDLTVDSPYNTYTHTGLPPGPIASPGLKSILAALYPADSEYLYFVANGEGGHIFSKTLAEHERAVLEYRKTMRKIRARQPK